MSCEVYRELLPAYLDDSLDEVRRAGLRSHLRSCAECRAFAFRREPTLALSLVDRREPPGDRVEACVAAVVAGVRQERLERRLRSTRRPWLAAAAAVLLAVGSSAAWWLTRDDGAAPTPLQAEVVEVGSPDPEAVEAVPPPAEPPPRVEVDMTQEEVRVYQYAIGDDATTGAVFIVNPAMEL